MRSIAITIIALFALTGFADAALKGPGSDGHSSVSNNAHAPGPGTGNPAPVVRKHKVGPN